MQELEEMGTRKIELENELQSLNGREKTLIERISSIEEKMALHDLDKKVKAKREAVNQLECRIKELEAKLKP